MSEEQISAHWRNFFVDVAGNTNGAHQSYVNKLRGGGHTQVSSLDECDYCVVFCPVASRVGTDVNEALDRDAVTVGKPVILVVMHHTFKTNHIVAESKRLVNKANVRLTVDCLFYEGRLLDSKTNDLAWQNIQESLTLSKGLLSQVLHSTESQYMYALLLVLFIILIILLVLVVKFMKIY